jgi:hypothetical protein
VSRRIFGLAASLAIAASLLGASVASAHSGDRNHDRISDRWEKQHHLSLKVKQTKLDQDHDGLNNLGEFRSNTDPRDPDTDNDGIDDNDENAGKIASFTGGVLTITLAKGGTLSGLVNDQTEIECEGSDSATAQAADHGGDGQNGGGDDNGENNGGSAGAGDNGDQGDDNGGSCAADALTANRTVNEAELKTIGGQAVFEKVQLGA